MTVRILLISRKRRHRPRIYDMKTKRNPILFALVVISALLSISAVSVDRLKAHVTWLSDPAREGVMPVLPALPRRLNIFRNR